MSESEKEVTVDQLLRSIEQFSSQIENTKLVTDIGLPNQSKISKTKEDAINRAEYEEYMKTSEVDNGNISKAVDNIAKNLLDDLLDRNF